MPRYQVTAYYTNGYTCSCCRQDWDRSEVVDSIDKAVAYIIEAKKDSDEFTHYTVEYATVPLSDSDRSELTGKIKAIEDKVAEDKRLADEAAAKAKRLSNLKDTLAALIKALADNRFKYTPEYIAILEADIARREEEIKQLESS